MKISDLECGLSCLISSALFGSMLYMMLYYDKENIMMKFQSILNDKQWVIPKSLYTGKVSGFLHFKSIPV